MTPASRSNAVFACIFLALAMVLGATRLHVFHRSGNLPPIAARKPMPPVSLPQLDGGEWNLTDHRGQVVLINYWATWCEPCQEELPGIIQLARDDAPKGLAVVGISLDSGPDTHAVVQQFAHRYRISYPVTFPAVGLTEAGLTALPTTILVDKQGRIAKTYAGAVEREDFAKDVATLIAED